MKKTLSLIAVAGLAIFLIGCSNTGVPVEDTNSQYEKVSVVDGKKITDGVVAPYYSWNPSGTRLIIKAFGPDTDFGLPGYVTYSVYNPASGVVLETDIQDSIMDPLPVWVSESEFVTATKDIKLKTDELVISDRSTDVPEGFEAFDVASKTWTSARAGETPRLGEAAQITYAPDFSAVTYLRGTPGEIHAFVWMKGATIETDATDLGLVGYGVESSYPALRWYGNKYVVSTETGELFDVIQKKQILSRRGGGGYERRITVLSPDSVSAIVIDQEQDRVDQKDYNHESYRLYILNLATGAEQEILKGTSPSSVRLFADWSPDSKYIVYNQDKDLWMANIETGEKRKITTNQDTYTNVAWSPSGDMLAVNVGGSVWFLSLGEPK